MKRLWIILVNIIIMIAMLFFVSIYSYYEKKDMKQRQIEHFENVTISMERVTENYLEGEQRVCDVWAHYIDSKNMTINEAISFIRVSHVLPNASAHIIDKETKEGLSTKPRTGTTDDYVVRYANYDFLKDLSWIHEIGTSVNVSCEFTNNISGEQSIAFCNYITLYESGTPKEAILLRVLPSQELTDKWIFPQEEFENTDFAIIDFNGNYIINGYSFKNSSFFEFYKSYNKTNSTAQQEFFNKITSSSGSFAMLNSNGEECILAHTPFDSEEFVGKSDWILLSLMPIKNLNVKTENWLLIGFVSIGLLILFMFDLAFMIYFNKRLQFAAKEADMANKAKTNFLSAMSHDIRTPMNAIVGFTTLAEKNIEDKESIKDNLHKITLASNHLLTLINDILDISKVESGKLTLCPQDFSIIDVVENLINLSLAMVKQKNIDFSFNVEHIEKEIIHADMLRLNQIFINIISNAIKYTFNDGKVSVKLKEDVSQKEGYIKIIYEVADTGIGMSPEFMKNMYLPFERQVDSRVNSIQGTGLGLAITKQMVDLMEGNIECQSEEGTGTIFTVTLDLPYSKKKVDNIMLESLNVLLIDPDEYFLKSSKETIESLGLIVDTAKTSLEGIDLIKNNHKDGKDYNILIHNYDIDSINEIVKIKDEIGYLPTILITAYDLKDIDNNLNSNINGFLNKPFFKSKVFEKINEILGNENKSIDLENDYSDLEGLNILVAEDYDINYEIISSLLAMYNINTERAINGLECVNKMKEAKEGYYALIFMDIQMPVMNGLDATKKIRKLDSFASSIPIIAMTSDAFSENINECFDVGMNGHIAKPVDIKIVLKEIRRIKEESKK